MITRQLAKDINSDIQAALQQVAQKHGLQFKAGNLRFSQTEIRTTINFQTVQTGVVRNPEVEAYEQFARLRNWTLKVGERFTTNNGDQFILLGYKPSRPKYPISAKSVRDGKTYKLTEGRFLTTGRI
jgi:hypothetical protein